MKRHASHVTFSIAFSLALGLGPAACSWIAGIEEIRMATDDGGPLGARDTGGASDASAASDTSDAPADAIGMDAVADMDAASAPDGSGCEAGTTRFQGDCYPKVIASGLAQPIALAVVAGSVVWAENALGAAAAGAVRSCPVTGCAGAPHDVLVSVTKPRIRQAGDGGVPVVYDAVGGASGIGVREIVSGTTTSSITGASGAIAATASATYALWQADALYFCTRGSCTATVLTLPNARVVANGGPVSLEGDRFYGALAGGGIGTCTLPNCADFVAVGSDSIAAMINDGAGALYVPTNGSKLVFLPASGGTSQPGATIPLGIGTVFALAADGTSAFVGAASGIYAGARADGQTLTQRFAAPARDVALDATFVYWAEPGSGRIMVAPR